jgi:rod shape-determining protein MreB
MTYLRDEFKLLIGEKTAESVKMAIASVEEGQFMEAQVRGRDLVTGLPREVIITDSDIREAIMAAVTQLVDDVREVLETTPPEILSDVMHRGLVLSGGGALLSGLDHMLENALKIPIYVAEDPLTAVARGCGVVLDNIDDYQEQLLSVTNDLPPR